MKIAWQYFLCFSLVVLVFCNLLTYICPLSHFHSPLLSLSLKPLKFWSATDTLLHDRCSRYGAPFHVCILPPPPLTRDVICSIQNRENRYTSLTDGRTDRRTFGLASCVMQYVSLFLQIFQRHSLKMKQGSYDTHTHTHTHTNKYRSSFVMFAPMRLGQSCKRRYGKKGE